MPELSKVPWELVGHRVQETRIKLDRALEEAGQKERSVLVEVTLYQQADNNSPPITEYNVSSGEIGVVFPPDEKILEGEEADDEDVVVRKILEGAYEQLQQDLENAGLGLFVPGVRALVGTSSTTTYCAGIRCEYWSIRRQWWLRRYRRVRGTCRKIWLQPCDHS